MKILLTILLSLFLVGGFSQSLPQGNPVTNSTSWIKYAFLKSDSGYIPAVRTDTNMKARYYGTEIIFANAGVDTAKWFWNGFGWKRNSSTVDSSLFVTHTALNDTLLGYVKIQTQNPTATLTGGSNYELHSAGTFTPTLNYSAGRLAAGTNVAATSPFASITVAGVSKSTTGCSSPPCTISDTQRVTVTYNTNTSFSNVVLTTDGKSATATTSFNAYSKIYIGYSSTSTPTPSELYAGANSFLNTTGNTIFNTPLIGNLAAPSSPKYVFFAFLSTITTPLVYIGGLQVSYISNPYNSFTNQSGGIANYTVLVSPLTTTGAISYSLHY